MDMESRVLGGTISYCPSGHRLFFALAFYTIIICTICYIVLTPASTTRIVINTPTEARHKTKIDNEYIFSLDHLDHLNVSTKKTTQSALNTTMAPTMAPRPSVRQYYRTFKDSEPLDKTCSSCAIVSSSGQLLGTKAGKEIDNKTCVFRMNAAPVKNYEADVGKRTTLRVLCFNAAKPLKRNSTYFLNGTTRPETVLFWGLNQPKHKSAKTFADAVALEYADSDVSFYSQMIEGEDAAGDLFMQETGFKRDKTATWLSTGWFTVMLALDMCQEIHMYGMIPDEYCKNHQKDQTKYHYFQNGAKPTECGYYKSMEGSTKGGHRFITEKAVFARWGKKYNMKFHYPDWDLDAVNISEPINTPFSRKQAVLEARKKNRISTHKKGINPF